MFNVNSFHSQVILFLNVFKCVTINNKQITNIHIEKTVVHVVSKFRAFIK